MRTFNWLKRLRKSERGNALAIGAATLPLLLGSAAFTVDTIHFSLMKRQLQRAADSGAIAGVYAIVQDEGARTNVSTAVDKDLTYNNHIAYTYSKTVGAPTSGAFKG